MDERGRLAKDLEVDCGMLVRAPFACLAIVSSLLMVLAPPATLADTIEDRGNLGL